MAFDVAKIIGELLLTLFATYGLELQEGAGKGGRDAQRGERLLWIGTGSVCD